MAWNHPAAAPRLGLRREAERHAAFARTGRNRVCKLTVRSKAVSRLPPCHRSPRPRGSFLSLSQIVATELFNLLWPGTLCRATIRKRMRPERTMETSSPPSSLQDAISFRHCAAANKEHQTTASSSLTLSSVALVFNSSNARKRLAAKPASTPSLLVGL